MPDIIHLSDDLIFSSRVTGTARDLNLSVATARTPTMLLQQIGSDPPSCVIVDLALTGLEASGLVAALNALSRRPRIVAYGSHVDTATLQAARDAGCDLVYPRSKFVAELSNLLPEWVQSTGDPTR